MKWIFSLIVIASILFGWCNVSISFDLSENYWHYTDNGNTMEYDTLLDKLHFDISYESCKSGGGEKPDAGYGSKTLYELAARCKPGKLLLDLPDPGFEVPYLGACLR